MLVEMHCMLHRISNILLSRISRLKNSANTKDLRRKSLSSAECRATVVTGTVHLELLFLNPDADVQHGFVWEPSKPQTLSITIIITIFSFSFRIAQKYRSSELCMILPRHAKHSSSDPRSRILLFSTVTSLTQRFVNGVAVAIC